MLPASTLEAASTDVVDLGGVAMAPDGTGGVVYRKLVDGRPHIFAAQFVEGAWRPPQRIDRGQHFDSYWPAIGAANGGQLVIVWVQEFGAGSDRMFSASLDAGARMFQDPVAIDFNVGEALATYPSLAMNRAGQAYLVYRVLPDGGSTAGLPPGYVRSDQRLMRYSGAVWSGMGVLANRNSSAPVATPTAENAPKAAIDNAGNGFVAFQEPDDEFIDRVWARRLFGSTVGFPQLVSPQRWADRPLRGAADAFDLDTAGFGYGVVAFRQQPGEDSAFTGARIMANSIPEAFVDNARDWQTARLIDGAGEQSPPDPGPPSVAASPLSAFVAAFGMGPASVAAPGDEEAIGQLLRLDDGQPTEPGDPQVDTSASGASAFAWKVRTPSLGAVGLRELRRDATWADVLVSAAAGGEPRELDLAGSGLGDALVAFRQDVGDARQIAVAAIDAPPEPFAVQTPPDFINRREYRLRWDPAPHAIGGVRYAVRLNGAVIATDLTGTEIVLSGPRLPAGLNAVQVTAVDPGGQSASTDIGEIKVDRRAPTVRLAVRGRRVQVRVRDGAESSGVDTAFTTVAYGERRARTTRRMRHTYRRAGTYRVVVRVGDVAGNTARVRRMVRIR